MKITVIGGGSTYTPELVQGFIQLHPELPLEELWLMDINADRLKVVGSFAQRIVQAAGAPFRIILSTNQRESVSGASYVITQLRVGGMAKALRTIPVILDIAKDIQETAPKALLLNFTNPAGLVTESLTRYAPEVKSVGVCNVGITAKMMILEKLADMGQEISPERAELDTLGLNHLTWHRGFRVDGEDIWNQIFPAYLEELRSTDEPEWAPALLDMLGMIPNYYLEYYYSTKHKLSLQDQWPPSRAEEVIAIEKDLLADFSDPALTTPPEDLLKRGGAWYSTLATHVIHSHYADLGQVHVVNLPHHGAVEGWPSDWVLEMPARVDASGVHPLPAAPLPPAQAGLVAAVKSYELLTVEAAVHGDRRSAYLALLAHPLGPQSENINAVLDDMLETNQTYLPQFFA